MKKKVKTSGRRPTNRMTTKTVKRKTTDGSASKQKKVLTKTAPTTPKSGTKTDYLAKHGIKVRPVTAKDKQFAQTDYQKKAKCIISIKGHKFFSANGSLADCKAVVRMTQHQTGGKNGKK